MSEDSSDTGDSLEYSDDSDTYSVEFGEGIEEPSEVAVTAVAAISGRKQDDLDPLYYAVDPDALDSLFQPTARGNHRGDVEVSFTYHGFDVSVRSYGIIEITEHRDGTNPADGG